MQTQRCHCGNATKNELNFHRQQQQQEQQKEQQQEQQQQWHKKAAPAAAAATATTRFAHPATVTLRFPLALVLTLSRSHLLSTFL